MVELTHIATSSAPSPAKRTPASSSHHQPVATITTLVRLAPGELLHRGIVDRHEDTRLSVVEGVLYAVVDELEYVLTPGDRITIPAGDPHRIWNAGDEPARVIAERRPR